MPFTMSRFHTLHQLWYGPDLAQVQGRRERRALILCSGAMLLMGLTWGGYFALLGNWPVAALDLLLLLGGLGSGLLLLRKQVHWAAVITFGTLISVICVIAWFFDVSTPQAPRTTHLYLLPLGLAAMMAFRESGAWLRYGVTALCLVAVGVLSVRYGTALPQYALPESVRAFGAWIQTGVALALLYGMLLVMQNDTVVRSILEEELRQALKQGQFQLYFQPQVDDRGVVVAAEALIRWLHPQRGLVLPGQFIEVAEHSGLMLPIGQWVLQKACEQLSAWATQPACKNLRLAVNISQVQFRQKDFVPQLENLIERYGIQPALLELEITESMVVQDMPDMIEKMAAIRARGVSFSLDDFGTGYSSLNHVKKLPLHQIKLDQSFVRDVLTDSTDASVARTLVALGHTLGLTVVAEGVESLEQYGFLLDCGCEYFQGFLFSPALPADEFALYVGKHVEALNSALVPFWVPA